MKSQSVCFVFLSAFGQLTRDGDGKLVRFDGKQPAAQLVVAAVCRSDQSDGTFAVGRLVVERHLLISRDFIGFCGDRKFSKLVMFVWQERTNTSGFWGGLFLKFES